MTYLCVRGNSLEWLPMLCAENSVDSIVTDPPYELGFMGKGWDNSGIANNVQLWKECLRVLKPGGHLLAFSGSRTYHRMTCAIEDAGFEIRDQIMWVYGSGMPKNAAQLKPAHEPVCVARKPFPGSMAACIAQHGTGGLNTGACRVGDEVLPERARTPNDRGTTFSSIGAQTTPEREGRYPSNLMHDGSPDVLALFPDSAARFFKQIDLEDSEWLIKNLHPRGAPIAESSSPLQNVADAIALSDAVTSALPEGIALHVVKAPSTTATVKESRTLCEAVTIAMRSIGQRFLQEWQRVELSPTGSPASIVATREPTGTMMITASHWRSDGSADPVTFSLTPCTPGAGGAASRFRYCAKASRADRDEGLEALVAIQSNFAAGTGFTKNGDGSPRNVANTAKNPHPTVKPNALMRYLCRLVTPAGGTIVDPFMGSGSTGKAAVMEGFTFIGFDLDPTYVEVSQARIAQALKDKDTKC